MAAHQGGLQDLLNLIVEPQVLVSILDTFVIELIRRIVFKVAHLVNHSRGFLLFTHIETAGDLAVVAWEALVAKWLLQRLMLKEARSLEW